MPVPDKFSSQALIRKNDTQVSTTTMSVRHKTTRGWPWPGQHSMLSLNTWDEPTAVHRCTWPHIAIPLSAKFSSQSYLQRGRCQPITKLLSHSYRSRKGYHALFALEGPIKMREILSANLRRQLPTFIMHCQKDSAGTASQHSVMSDTRPSAGKELRSHCRASWWPEIFHLLSCDALKRPNPKEPS